VLYDQQFELPNNNLKSIVSIIKIH
jgi:hypothetical protein